MAWCLHQCIFMYKKQIFTEIGKSCKNENENERTKKQKTTLENNLPAISNIGFNIMTHIHYLKSIIDINRLTFIKSIVCSKAWCGESHESTANAPKRIPGNIYWSCYIHKKKINELLKINNFHLDYYSSRWIF